MDILYILYIKMSTPFKSRPALLLIDIQEGFNDHEYWGGDRNNLDAESNMQLLLDTWRAKQLPLFHIKHCSLEEGSPLAKTHQGNQFKPFISPKTSEPIIEKHANSAFIGTDLYDQLKNNAIVTVVIIGLTTDHCVSTTTRMAGNYGFETILIEDAVATFPKKGVDGTLYSAQLIHDTAIASLKDEFATILSTSQVIKQLN